MILWNLKSPAFFRGETLKKERSHRDGDGVRP
jgi:hypothetical protein